MKGFEKQNYVSNNYELRCELRMFRLFQR